MCSQQNRLASKWVALVVLMIAASLVACAASSSTTLATPSTATTPTVSSMNSPIENGTRAAIRNPITSSDTITLTLWSTEDLSLKLTPAGYIWNNQFDAFTIANPNIHIDVVLKQPYGKGGLLDFLLTTAAVAPKQLPDLITLDLADIPTAAEAGTLQPLDAFLSTQLTDDLFPFAYRASRYQNQWVALPFVVEAQHLVYNKSIIKKPPLTWDEFYRQKGQILLPLASDDAFTLQYASMTNMSDGNVSLDLTTTALVLSFFKRAHDSGLIDDSATLLKSSDDAWVSFTKGQVAFAQVSTTSYLSEREKLPDAQFAPVPTRDGKSATPIKGWAFAMATNDPVRQAAAARFIQWLVQSDRLTIWLRIAHRLPASRATVNPVVMSADYAAFLRELLERGIYLPRTPANEKVAAAWRAAIPGVIKNQTTPEEAARSIVNTSK